MVKIYKSKATICASKKSYSILMTYFNYLLIEKGDSQISLVRLEQKWMKKVHNSEVAPLENLANFTGKHLCQSLFFNKVAG